LDVQSLSADPDGRVAGTYAGTLAAGGRYYYLLTAAAAGSIEVELDARAGAAGAFKVELLGLDESADPDELAVLAGGTAPAGSGGVVQAGAAVRQGQPVLVRVSGDAAAAGNFRLAYENLDPFATSRNGTVVLPDPAGPSRLAVGDLNGDGRPDLVVSNTLFNTVSVFLGNGNGTFQSPRQFDVGAFALTARGLFVQSLPSFGRGLTISDFDRDGIPDVAVTNYSSADVSVLIGRGDGSFRPQRRTDATTAPLAVAAGDLNGDGLGDLVALDSPATDEATVAALLGRGDGTFRPQRVTRVPSAGGFPPGAVRVADFNEDGRPDLAVAALNDGLVHVLQGAGDGTFSETTFATDVNSTLVVADLDGDGHLDLGVCGVFGSVEVFLGRGDGTFVPLGGGPAGHAFFAGQVPVAVTAVDFRSEVQLPDGGGPALGPPDGHPDFVVANSGISLGNQTVGPPEVVVLPALLDDQGRLRGFGAPRQLARAVAPIDLAVIDLNGDGAPDVATIQEEGVRLIFGGGGGGGGGPATIPPNDTPASARNLGTVVHVLEPTLTITPDRPDAWFAMSLPAEAAGGGRDEVLDMSARFGQEDGAGLGMELIDPATRRVLAAGERFRVGAPQRGRLLLHVFGVRGADGMPGSGAYTLDLDVLPQLVSARAQPILPPGRDGHPTGPTASIVLNFQGDRLDPAAAAEPANYRVTWLGRDRAVGTADDQVVPLGGEGSRVVYNPGSNVDVPTGREFPTAVHQTVTLVFARPLPAGSYLVELSPAVGSEAFTADEPGLLATGEGGLAGHPLVWLSGDQLVPGARTLFSSLVPASRSAGADFRFWERGTPFLGQLHDDLSTLLDRLLTVAGDQATITPDLLDEVAQRFGPGLAAALSAGVSILVIFLDPVDMGLLDPAARRVAYGLDTGEVVRGIPGAYVVVASNVELVALPVSSLSSTPHDGGEAVARYLLDVANVQGTSRGGAVTLGPGGVGVLSFTDAMRGGQRRFEIDVRVPEKPGLDAGTFAPLAPARLAAALPFNPAPATDAAPPTGIAVAVVPPPPSPPAPAPAQVYGQVPPPPPPRTPPSPPPPPPSPPPPPPGAGIVGIIAERIAKLIAKILRGIQPGGVRRGDAERSDGTPSQGETPPTAQTQSAAATSGGASTESSADLPLPGGAGDVVDRATDATPTGATAGGDATLLLFTFGPLTAPAMLRAAALIAVDRERRRPPTPPQRHRRRWWRQRM
jgi:hypothetical protein